MKKWSVVFQVHYSERPTLTRAAKKPTRSARIVVSQDHEVYSSLTFVRSSPPKREISQGVSFFCHTTIKGMIIINHTHTHTQWSVDVCDLFSCCCWFYRIHFHTPSSWIVSHTNTIYGKQIPHTIPTCVKIQESQCRRTNAKTVHATRYSLPLGVRFTTQGIHIYNIMNIYISISV